MHWGIQAANRSRCTDAVPWFDFLHCFCNKAKQLLESHKCAVWRSRNRVSHRLIDCRFITHVSSVSLMHCFRAAVFLRWFWKVTQLHGWHTVRCGWQLPLLAMHSGSSSARCCENNLLALHAEEACAVMPTCLLAIVLAPSCSTELRIGTDPDQALRCFSLCGSQSSDMSRTRSGIATGFSHCLSMLSSSNVSYPVANWTQLKFLGRLGGGPLTFKYAHGVSLMFHSSSISLSASSKYRWHQIFSSQLLFIDCTVTDMNDNIFQLDQQSVVQLKNSARFLYNQIYYGILRSIMFQIFSDFSCLMTLLHYTLEYTQIVEEQLRIDNLKRCAWSHGVFELLKYCTVTWLEPVGSMCWQLHNLYLIGHGNFE